MSRLPRLVAAALVPTAVVLFALDPLAARAATGVAGGAAAGAQGAFDMGMLTNTMAQGAIVTSERSRAARTGKARSGGSQAPSAAATRALLTYRPDPAARKRNVELFLKQIEGADPEGAKGLRATFARTDVLGGADRALRAVGLRADNLADAMAAYLVNAWYGTRGSTDGGKPQYVAVSRQLAAIAGSTPALRGASNATKQQTAEFMILHALLVDSSVTAAKGKPAQMTGVRAAVAQGAKASFGFDLREYNLGANGFAPKAK